MLAARAERDCTGSRAHGRRVDIPGTEVSDGDVTTTSMAEDRPRIRPRSAERWPGAYETESSARMN